MRKRELVVVFVSYSCKFFVDLPHGVMGWSAVCDCGIFWSYSLTLFILHKLKAIGKPRVFPLRITNLWIMVAEPSQNLQTLYSGNP